MTSLSDVEPAGGGGHLAVLKIELSQKKREMVTHGKWMVNLKLKSHENPNVSKSKWLML